MKAFHSTTIQAANAATPANMDVAAEACLMRALSTCESREMRSTIISTTVLKPSHTRCRMARHVSVASRDLGTVCRVASTVTSMSTTTTTVRIMATSTKSARMPSPSSATRERRLSRHEPKGAVFIRGDPDPGLGGLCHGASGVRSFHAN